MRLFELGNQDISKELMEYFEITGYVCVDTETTGLDYLKDDLCTIQLYAEEMGVILQFDKVVYYNNLKKLFLSNNIVKIFHNAVFDVSFLMENLKIEEFNNIVCTRIASKIVNGLKHNNSLKPLLKEYLNVEISKKQQLSDWSQEVLTEEQKEYAMNDVRYLKLLWDKLYFELVEKKENTLAYACFSFIPNYKKLTDKVIENIFVY